MFVAGERDCVPEGDAVVYQGFGYEVGVDGGIDALAMELVGRGPEAVPVVRGVVDVAIERIKVMLITVKE